MLYPIDFVFHFTARGLHHHHIALLFPNECAGNGRIDGDFMGFHVRLVIPDYQIPHFLIGFQIDYGHGSAEVHFTRVLNGSDIDHMGIAQLAFDLLNAAFTKALLLSCRVVLGVFFQVAMFARLGNCLNDARTLYPFKILHLFAYALSAAHGHWNLTHALLSHAAPATAALAFVCRSAMPCTRPRPRRVSWCNTHCDFPHCDASRRSLWWLVALRWY